LVRPCWEGSNGLFGSRLYEQGVRLCGRTFIYASILVTNSVSMIAVSAELRADSMLSS
jgi:hypothetical protein